MIWLEKIKNSYLNGHISEKKKNVHKQLISFSFLVGLSYCSSIITNMLRVIYYNKKLVSPSRYKINIKMYLERNMGEILAEDHRS